VPADDRQTTHGSEPQLQSSVVRRSAKSTSVVRSTAV
jgi:hypothetical protein